MMQAFASFYIIMGFVLKLFTIQMLQKCCKIFAVLL